MNARCREVPSSGAACTAPETAHIRCLECNLLADYRELQVVLIEEFTGYRRGAYESELFWVRQLRPGRRPILD